VISIKATVGLQASCAAVCCNVSATAAGAAATITAVTLIAGTQGEVELLKIDDIRW
jgi:hypothetical protein